MTGASRKDYIWNTVGVLLQNALSPLLLILVTRINGVYDSGIFSFAFSMAVIFMALSMWGGRTYQVSDSHKKHRYESYITARVILAAVAFVGSIIFVMLNQYDQTKSLIVISLTLMKVIESVADSIHGVMQVNGGLYVAGKSLAYKAIISLVLFVAVDFATKSLLLSSVSLVVANIAMVFLYDLPSVNRMAKLRLSADKLQSYYKEALRILVKCTPAFAVTFLATLSLNIPRYFLDKVNPDQVAYYGIFAMPITLVVLLVSFILQPNVVGLSDQYAKRDYPSFDKSVRGIVVVSLLIGLFAVLATIVAGIWLLELVFGVGLKPFEMSLVIMVVGAVFNAVVAICIVVYTIMRRFKAQFYILLASNIALLLVCVVLYGKIDILWASTLFMGVSLVQAMMLTIQYLRLRGELLLINDGSPRGESKKIIDEYAKKEPGVITAIHHKNIGAAATRNKGIDLAKGNYLTFLDQDDTLEADFVATYYEAIKGNGGDVVQGGFRSVDNAGVVMRETMPVRTDYGKLLAMPAWAKIYKTDFLRDNQIRFFSNNIGEDIPFSTAVARYADYGWINYAGYNHFSDNEQSVTNSLHKGLSPKINFLALLDAMYQAIDSDDPRNGLEEYSIIRTGYYYLLSYGRSASASRFTEAYEEIFDWFNAHGIDAGKNRYVWLPPRGEKMMVRAAMPTLTIAHKLKMVPIFAKLYAKG